MAMPDIPMYVFTGFLESRKTKFIQETLEDERFNTGERTLLLVFEEGEEEYDVSTYPHKEVYEQVLDYEDLSPELLTGLQKKYRAERVVVELNGMHLAADFYLKTPDHWKIAQEVMFADATTFLSYNANMRQLVVDKLAGAEMLVLNRMAPGTDVMPYHKIARAVNRKIDILYEYTDGSTHYDDIEDPLPFDLNAPVVEIRDEDYALFYRDITEEPKKYAGKTVKFKGQVARLRREKEGMFAPGRFVMTCCEADITFMGLPCRFAAASGLTARSWVWVTATVEVKYHTLYKGVGPILTAVNVQPAEPAEQNVATFLYDSYSILCVPKQPAETCLPAAFCFGRMTLAGRLEIRYNTEKDAPPGGGGNGGVCICRQAIAFPRRAARRSAATIPTISTAACWLRLSIWKRRRRSRCGPIPSSALRPRAMPRSRSI